MTLVVVLLALVLALRAARPASQPSPSAASGTLLTWLAAGDSYSSGQGLNNTTEPCARGMFTSDSLAYPLQAYDDVHRAMPKLNDPAFTACTGAVTGNFFNSGDAEHAPQWQPKGARYDLVTFTFGGDNIDFPGIVNQCVLGPLDIWPFGTKVHASDPGHKCPDDAWVRKRIHKRLTTDYQRFLSHVAKAAVKRGGNIIVLGYPELLAAPNSWLLADRVAGACEGIWEADARQLRGEAGDLNATISHDVAVVNSKHPNGVHLSFLDVNSGGRTGPVTISRNDPYLFEPAGGASHNLCGKGTGWLNGVVKLHPSTRSFHPSLLGNVAEGHLLAQVLTRLRWPSTSARASAGSGGSGHAGTSGGTGTPVSVSLGWRLTTYPSDASSFRWAVPNAVSCSTDLYCVAVGNSPGVTVVTSDDGGEHWTARGNLGHGALSKGTAVSCPSAEDCVAVGGIPAVDHENGAAWVTRTAGRSWSRVVAFNGDPADAVSCATTSHCVAVSDVNYGSWVTDDGGVTWTASNFRLASGAFRRGVSCTTAVKCLAAGFLVGFRGVSCVTAARCVAAGDLSSQAGPGRPIAMVSGDGGRTWDVSRLPVGLTTSGTATAISCTSSSTCLVVGYVGKDTSPVGDAWLTGNGGKGWTEEARGRLGPQMPTSVSCATGTMCAVTTNTSVATTWDSGRSWTVQRLSGAFHLHAVSCATSTHCVAVGYGSFTNFASWVSRPGVAGASGTSGAS